MNDTDNETKLWACSKCYGEQVEHERPRCRFDNEPMHLKHPDAYPNYVGPRQMSDQELLSEIREVLGQAKDEVARLKAFRKKTEGPEGTIWLGFSFEEALDIRRALHSYEAPDPETKARVLKTLGVVSQAIKEARNQEKTDG